MIKINLLPAYIIERRVVRRLMNMFVAFAILLILGIVGITYGYYGRSTARVNEDLQQNWAAGRDEAQDLNRKISTLKTDQESRLDVFLKFKDDVDRHNQNFPWVLETVNRYLFKAVVVDEIEIENDQLRLKGRIDNNENLGTFYANLRRCPALVPGSVKIDDVEEYPIQRKGAEGVAREIFRPAVPGAPGLPGPPGTSGSWPSAGAPMPSTMSLDFLEGPITVPIPRAEYEFSLTATLMPEYALAPPPSPLVGALEGAGYAPGVSPRRSGGQTVAPPPTGPPSAASGRRELREPGRD